MTENNARIIPTINAVDNFNPADFTRQLPNEDGTMSLYLDVKYRLLWFRLHRPNGKIDSEIIHAGFEMTPIAWDEKYKGIDDLLLSFKEARAS